MTILAELAPLEAVIDQPVDTYTIEPGCPNCGGALAPITVSKPLPSMQNVMLRCAGDCGRQYRLTITLRHEPSAASVRRQAYRTPPTERPAP